MSEITRRRTRGGGGSKISGRIAWPIVKQDSLKRCVYLVDSPGSGAAMMCRICCRKLVDTRPLGVSYTAVKNSVSSLIWPVLPHERQVCLLGSSPTQATTSASINFQIAHLRRRSLSALSLPLPTTTVPRLSPPPSPHGRSSRQIGPFW